MRSDMQWNLDITNFDTMKWSSRKAIYLLFAWVIVKYDEKNLETDNETS